jgi:diguanylate cyclase (GGDEF)-like protein
VRFAIVSLVLVVVLGVLMAQLLASMIAKRALESAKDAAVLTTTIAIQPLFTPAELAKPLTPDKIAALDRAVHGSRHGTEIARIKIWHDDGEVLYVADPHTASPLHPNSKPSDELEAALQGEIEAEIISSSAETDNVALLERYGTLLEVYVPIVYSDSAKPAGVFELYLPYAPVQASIRADTTRAVALLFLGLVVLWLGLFRTVATASRRLREESARNEHQALHDALTGLGNRTRLERELALAVEQAEHTVALVLLDLDRFREVNDTLGHARGDEVVLEMASRLTALAGPDDLVARLGGDEFAVLLRDVDGVESAMVHAEVLRGALGHPVHVGGVEVALDARAGVSVHPGDAVDGPTLLQHADVATEDAKRTHTGVRVYDPALDQHSTERLGLLAELGRAIAQGELVLHYQPKCDLNGRVLGVEALVRWQHPQRGLLPPMDFIPVAERTGLVHPLTEVVLDLALAQARCWMDEGRPMPVAVNVSTRSLLHPGFAEKVLAAMGAHGVPARLLSLEITETTIMEDPERALAVLTRLADSGVRLSIDDFGTGYSSLAYLKQLPVHELKVDRTFVAALTTSERDRVIVDSTVALGNRLGLDVVAEGVEDIETLDALAELGCRTAQGYLFSRPVPADQLDLGVPARLDDPSGPPAGAARQGADRVS